MPLMSGAMLGSYEITHSLGAGGMGEVYRARDRRLGRSVAIKIILESLASDRDRVARFEREAKALASINHPNIAALYGMEQAQDHHFLVMELVEGETLAERLKRGPLAVEEAVRVALQIAEALEAAHDKSIIHRDLKPANIKITPDDKVKVLDFGLAKTLDAAPDHEVANSPTLSMMATNAGIILGTAAYMSPEQAKGLAVDHRSDVFSFGVVLYEMLTGRQPFQGETAPDILASVLVREPELQWLPADLNPRISELLRRCLDKNPKRRWQAIGDVRAEIEAVAASPRTSTSQISSGAPTKPLWLRTLPVALTSVVAGVVVGVAVWQLKPAPPREITRFAVVLPGEQPLTGVAGKVLDISPDGRRLAYTAAGKLYVRSMPSLIATPVQGAENQRNVVSPVFSPDSQHLAFYSETGILKRTAVRGGAAVPVCPAPSRPLWITWTGDSIFFTAPDGVMRVSANGGTPDKIVNIGPGERVQRAQMLPDGETMLLTIVPAGTLADRWANAQIVAQSLRSAVRKVLVTGAADGWYLPTGHLAYTISGGLYAVEFDLGHLQVKGAPVQVVEGVRRSNLATSGIAWFSVSDTGTLAYMRGPASLSSTELDVAFVDRNGTVTALKLPPAAYKYPRVSPDGKRIALETDDGQEAVVRLYEPSRTPAPPRRLTFVGKNRFPIWTSDSKRVVFQSDRQGDLGIFWQAADGTGDAERLTRAAADENHIPESWHPGAGVMLFSVVKNGEYTLWTYSVRDKKSAPFSGVRSAIPTDALFSPDGRWVAYSSGTFNSAGIYVEPFPTTGAKYELPPTGAGVPHHPLWFPDRTSLAFNQRAGNIDDISIVVSPTFAFGNTVSKPKRFETGPPNVRRAFDVMPDGRIVGLITPGDAESASSVWQVDVVLNWFEELKQRMRTR